MLFADGGFGGREYPASMESLDIELITPAKHRLGERLPGGGRKGPHRLVIEAVFSTLKRQMRLETHLAKTAAGLAQRIAQRLLALTGRCLRQRPDRSPAVGPCRLRRTMNPHQASRGSGRAQG